MTHGSTVCSQHERQGSARARSWPGTWSLAWQAVFGRRGGAPSAGSVFESRLHRDIGLDPPETWSDGRCGRDFTRYLQYY